jgi:phage regulator Rha-like protein
MWSQIATSNGGRGGRRYSPYAFTEHGAIMAANVLNSKRAVRVSVYVVRAFVKLREMLSTHRKLAMKLAELEGQIDRHDHEVAALLDAIRQLMEPPPEKPRKPIGFPSESG